MLFTHRRYFFRTEERSGSVAIIYGLAILPLSLLIFMPVEYGAALRDAEAVKTSQLMGALAAHQELTSSYVASHIQGITPSLSVIAANAEARGDLYANINIDLRTPGRGYKIQMDVQSPTDPLCAQTTFSGEAVSNLTNILDLYADPLSPTLAVAGDYGEPYRLLRSCANHLESEWFGVNQQVGGTITGILDTTPVGMSTFNAASASLVRIVPDFDRDINGNHASHTKASSDGTVATLAATGPLQASTTYNSHVALYIPSSAAITEASFSASGTLLSASVAQADLTLRDRWQILKAQFTTDTTQSALQSVSLELRMSGAPGQTIYSDSWGFFSAN